MQTISVHPETHQLAKELSLSTSKSMHKVVAEALVEYQQRLSGSKNLMLSKFLLQVPKVVEEELKLVLVKEIPKAVRAVVEEIRSEQAKIEQTEAEKLAQLLRHATEATLPAATTTHPTKPWLTGGAESDDIKELSEEDAAEIEECEKPVPHITPFCGDNPRRDDRAEDEPSQKLSES